MLGFRSTSGATVGLALISNLKNGPHSGGDGLLPQTHSALADNRPLCPVSEWAGWRHHRRRLAAGCLTPRLFFFFLRGSFGKAKHAEQRMDGRGQSVKMTAVPCCSLLLFLCYLSPSFSPTLVCLSSQTTHHLLHACPYDMNNRRLAI